MLEPSIVLYSRERWRVVRTGDSDGPSAYAVVDTAGIELRRELNLDDARAWIDRKVVEGDARAPAIRRRVR